jgi:CubicO group peptidase (beta-lactamase class C family)
LQALADGVVRQGGTPALSIAVWHQDRLYRAASGILNVDTGVEATVDSVFQIGSVTKSFTASWLMLLVDEGRIDLDRPIKQYLQDFHVLDPAATQAITCRQLLSHTSGLASDPSLSPSDTDEYLNPIARYVDRCFLLPQVHEDLGKRFSYSNAGYVIAGRLAEVVSGMSWRTAMQERVFKPLGMAHALSNPAEALRFRAAIGHLTHAEGAQSRAAVVSLSYLPLSMAPTGSVLMMSAADLLRFGLAHLSGGKAQSGAQWMSAKSISTMQQMHVQLPSSPLLFETGWGPGWAFSECQGVRLLGHSGGSAGQQAFLGILPDHGAAFAVQLNGMTTSGSTTVLQSVCEDLLHEIAGVRAEKKAVVSRGETTRFTGKYAAAGFRFEVGVQDDALYGRVDLAGYADLPPRTYHLVQVAENRFEAYATDGARVYDFTFLEPDAQGKPKYLFYAFRLHPRG